MKKYSLFFYIIIITVCITNSYIICAKSDNFTLPYLNISSIHRLVRNPVELTDKQEELKSILDDPEAEKIADSKLLRGGILDDLIKIEKKYEEKYKQKAKPLLEDIYMKIKEGEKTFNSYRGIYNGEQGYINAVIMTEKAIEIESQIDTPEEGWTTWLRKQKLSGVIRRFSVPKVIKEIFTSKLKSILDNPNIEKIKGTAFLVNGILDEILEKNEEKYKRLYKKKATPLVLKIYQEVRKGKKDFNSYQGIFEGKQGFINAVIMVRDAIDEDLAGKVPPQEEWGKWLADQKLSGATQKFNVNNLIRKALAPELYPNKKEEPHLHVWEIITRIDWNTSEGKRIIKQAIPHILIDHMGLDWSEVPKRIKNWGDWAKKWKVIGILSKYFGNSPRKMIKFVVPQKFKKGILHDWNFRIGDWKTKEGDKIAREWIRYKIFKEEGWEVEGLADQVKSWDEWARKDTKFWTMIEKKFNDSVLRALRFGLKKEFDRGELKLGDFSGLTPGKGAADTVHPLTPLGKNYEKSIDGVVYYFGPNYKGYLVNKYSDDYGGLYTPDGVMVNIFPLEKRSEVRRVNLVKKGLLWDLPKDIDPLWYIKQFKPEELEMTEKEALGILKEDYGIEPFKLSSRERNMLVVVLRKEGKETFDEFYNKAGLGGVKVLANVGDYKFALRLAGAFSGWKKVFKNYIKISKLSKSIAPAFGREALGYENGNLPEDKYANYQTLLEFGVSGILTEANNRLMKLFDEFVSQGDKEKIAKVKQAQQELLLLTKMLDSFAKGKLTRKRSQLLNHSVKEYWFEYKGEDRNYDIRLITRPKEVETGRKEEHGEAAIRFHIPFGGRWRKDMAFRVDRTYDKEREEYIVEIDIDSPALSEAYRMGGFEETHHYSLEASQQKVIAQEDIFAWLVRMFY